MGAPAPTRIKVKRVDLIARVKVVMAEDVQKHKTAVAEHAQALKVWEAGRDKLADGLVRALWQEVERIAKNPLPELSSGYESLSLKAQARVEHRILKPMRPEPVDPAPLHARALRLLEMAQDETLSVSLGDALARYL